jgi:hypothetical protein
MADPSLLSPEYVAQNRSFQIATAAIVCGVLETIFVVLFFSSRFASKTLNGPEVWLMPWAYAFCLTHCIMIYCTCTPIRALGNTRREPTPG